MTGRAAPSIVLEAEMRADLCSGALEIHKFGRRD